MNAPVQTDPRIDYVKYIVYLDWDVAQQRLAHLLRWSKEGHTRLVQGSNFSFTILGPSEHSDGKGRYIFESWGQYAADLIDVLPTEWADHITRLDWRIPMLHTTSQMAEAYRQQTVMQPKGRKNITTFDGRHRNKTNTRDIGGRGLRWGSAKSDETMIVYIDPNGQVVTEIRLMGEQAIKTATGAVARWESGDGAIDLGSNIRYALQQAALGVLYRSTGCGTIGQLEAKMLQASGWWAQVHQAMELIDASAATTATFNQQGQTVGTQFNTGARYEPTEKGWATDDE